VTAVFGKTRFGDNDRLVEMPGLELHTPTSTLSPTSYVSAKIVLVGDSNVGKSCLALRPAQDRYEEQGTTHGMRLWTMPPEQLSPAMAAPPGEKREVVIWDLGGQDEYRLVHQLFLHDTVLALILLDPTRGIPGLEELAIARGPVPLPGLKSNERLNAISGAHCVGLRRAVAGGSRHCFAARRAVDLSGTLSINDGSR
jgi:GTPase SAR1 family protein